MRFSVIWVFPNRRPELSDGATHVATLLAD